MIRYIRFCYTKCTIHQILLYKYVPLCPNVYPTSNLIIPMCPNVYRIANHIIPMCNNVYRTPNINILNMDEGIIPMCTNVYHTPNLIILNIPSAILSLYIIWMTIRSDCRLARPPGSIYLWLVGLILWEGTRIDQISDWKKHISVSVSLWLLIVIVIEVTWIFSFLEVIFQWWNIWCYNLLY